MSALLLIILFVGLLAGTIVSMSPRRRSTATPSPKSPEPGTNALPCFRRTDFFTAAERSFYEILNRLTPNHTVFPKVRLTDLVSLPRTIEHQEQLLRLNQKHIDFVVCNKSLAPVVAIKLDDTPVSQASGRRDDFVEEVLAAAALPVIHLGTRRGHTFDEIHRLIAPYLRIGTPFI